MFDDFQQIFVEVRKVFDGIDFGLKASKDGAPAMGMSGYLKTHAVTEFCDFPQEFNVHLGTGRRSILSYYSPAGEELDYRRGLGRKSIDDSLVILQRLCMLSNEVSVATWRRYSLGSNNSRHVGGGQSTPLKHGRDDALRRSKIAHGCDSHRRVGFGSFCDLLRKRAERVGLQIGDDVSRAAQSKVNVSIDKSRPSDDLFLSRRQISFGVLEWLNRGNYSVSPFDTDRRMIVEIWSKQGSRNYVVIGMRGDITNGHI